MEKKLAKTWSSYSDGHIFSRQHSESQRHQLYPHKYEERRQILTSEMTET